MQAKEKEYKIKTKTQNRLGLHLITQSTGACKIPRVFFFLLLLLFSLLLCSFFRHPFFVPFPLPMLLLYVSFNLLHFLRAAFGIFHSLRQRLPCARHTSQIPIESGRRDSSRAGEQQRQSGRVAAAERERGSVTSDGKWNWNQQLKCCGWGDSDSDVGSDCACTADLLCCWYCAATSITINYFAWLSKTFSDLQHL